MKPAHTLFRDQVGALVGWFSSWNECEQTIALYTLLKRISTTQAKFLSLILEHTFRDDSVELQLLQQQANDKDFLGRLCRESKDVAVKQLLAHLPLLTPGNDTARYEYLQLLPKILTHTVEHSVHQQECLQLLSLALVHPAFPQQERNSLLCWLSHLEKSLGVQERLHPVPRGLSENHDLLPNTGCENLVRQNFLRGRVNGWRNQQLVHRDSGIGSFETQSQSPYGSVGGAISSSTSRKARSNSLTPPPPLQDSIPEDFRDCRHVETRPGRSQSFPVDPHKLNHHLSPQSSTESEQDDCVTRQRGSSFDDSRPGMRDVPAWLKSLRLHKYSGLFDSLSYEEMINMNEEYLASKDVTTGARNKILLSIKKLNERPEVLTRLDKDVLQCENLPAVLNELKQIVVTPIKPFSPPPNIPTSTMTHLAAPGCEPQQQGQQETLQTAPPHPDDLPALIMRVMGKACTQIVVSRADDDCCHTYVGLVDKLLYSEAFTQVQKRKLQAWKQQFQKYIRQQPYRRMSQEKGPPRGWSSHSSHGSGDSAVTLMVPAGSGNQRKVHRMGMQRGIGKQSNPLGAQMKKCRSTETSKPPLVRSHAIVGRTKSLPLKSSQQSISLPQQHSADFDGIDNSLESLCLSVTEHALADTADHP